AVRCARRLRQARVDLEVDVRHAARIAAREDRRERDGARAVGLLHAAQVVLVRQAARVHRVIAIALPGATLVRMSLRTMPDSASAFATPLPLLLLLVPSPGYGPP